MDTSLYIDLPKTNYRPGELLRGELLWALDEPPEKIELSLGWWTEGRGDKDANIEHMLEWRSMESAGKESFEMKLPESPYSFEGHLISLKWALELRTANGKQSTTLNLLIAPTDEPIALPLIEDESKRKSFSFRRSR